MEQPPQRRAHQVGMEHRVRLAGTVQRRCSESLQSMIGELQPGMLAGDEQPRRLAEDGECAGNRTEFDRFWTRSDNERDTRLAQLPP